MMVYFSVTTKYDDVLTFSVSDDATMSEVKEDLENSLGTLKEMKIKFIEKSEFDSAVM